MNASVDSGLVVQLRQEAEDRWVAISPGVGFWCDPPSDGTIVAPGNWIGSLRTLRQRVDLSVGSGPIGQVVGAPSARVVAVEFAQPLFTLRPIDGAVEQAPPAAAGSTDRQDLPDGHVAVLSPTDGVFYGRPTPDAQPFIEVGARVRKGQPVGLVEVMKTFNQILYGAAGDPAEAEVIEIRATDGDEVRSGQVLVVLR